MQIPTGQVINVYYFELVFKTDIVLLEVGRLAPKHDVDTLLMFTCN